MPFTTEQTRLAVMIDIHVTQVLADMEAMRLLLLSLADHMGTSSSCWRPATSAELNALCDRYEGLYRFAKPLLEMLAAGIADGRSPCRTESGDGFPRAR